MVSNELEFLRELSKQGVKYLLVGLSAATLQGAPVVTQDINLWFKDLGSQKLKKALDNLDVIYVPPSGLMPPVFAGDRAEMIDIVLPMDGLEDFEKEYKNANKFNIEGV